MAEIGKDFPLTRERRKELLKRIIENDKPVGTYKVPGFGRLDVYRIPLEYLSYNPYNTRFIAQAKTLEKRLGRKLNDENPDDLKEIEKFIWEEKQDKNANTIDSLLENGQLEPGVVTINGVILSGNRRFRLINEINRNYEQYGGRDELKYFEATILQQELTEKDIVRYESFYTYGTGDKVEYDPIQKYISAKGQKLLGFTEKEIADHFLQITEGEPKVVEKWLNVYALMEEYLTYIGEDGILTALKGTEEAFLKLFDTLKQLKTGKAGRSIWPFNDDDLDDLKCIFFNYIRMGKATHDFRIFLKFFSNKSRWDKFKADVDTVVDANPIETLDTYRKKHPSLSEKEISAMRQTDYASSSGKELNKIYGAEKAYYVNLELEETPIKIVEGILQKISKLEEDLSFNRSKEVYSSDDFLAKIKDVQSRIGKIKQEID